MRRQQALGVAVVVVLAGAGAGLVAYDAGLIELPGEDQHDRARVTFLDENGSVLTTVAVDVADSRKERVRGLSDRDALENGPGMLFVHGGEDERTYVMRDMDFPIDIVFVGSDRRVTEVHPAPVPPADRDQLTPYRGRAKWVVELPHGFAADHGIEPGVRIEIEYLD